MSEQMSELEAAIETANELNQQNAALRAEIELIMQAAGEMPE